jgi:REP element-mobilizing transposase RayT
MRFWLLTNTTYGTWLPGNRRGSVTSVRDRRDSDPPTSSRLVHNLPGEPWEDEHPGLCFAAVQRMNGPAIYFDLEKAEIVFVQFQETAAHRGWTLHAISIMASHFHIVVQVAYDPCPKKILAGFKAWASRRLNERYGEPPSETWWTMNGSKRKLANESHRQNAINYTLYKQEQPLIVWSRELGRIV